LRTFKRISSENEFKEVMMTGQRASFFLILIIFLQGMACKSNPTSSAEDWSRSLESLVQVDEFPLYVMHYFGDFDLLYSTSGVSADRGKTSASSFPASSWGCTCFAALNSAGDVVMGRNFDWYNHAALLLFTDPPGRYASISMVDISYLGVSKRDSPLEHSDQLRNLPYFPFDGMNEHGLSVGMMAVSEAEPPYDSRRRTIGCLEIIRVILDCARNVDEAVSFFDDYNISFTGGPPIHYMVTDASRHSAVIEFVDGIMHVLRNDQPWQVSTNFILTGLNDEQRQAACYRYRTAYVALSSRGGLITAREAVEILEDVAQSNTIWSIVYHAGAGDIHAAMGRKFGELHEFEL